MTIFLHFFRESDEISIEKLNDYHSEETKNLLTKEEASVVSEIKLHVFQAQVHVETEPVIDGTDNYQSPKYVFIVFN